MEMLHWDGRPIKPLPNVKGLTVNKVTLDGQRLLVTPDARCDECRCAAHVVLVHRKGKLLCLGCDEAARQAEEYHRAHGREDAGREEVP